MNGSKFKQSLIHTKTLLSLCELLKNSDFMLKPIDPTFYEIKSYKDLATIYLREIDKLNFNFLLWDESFFQFQLENMNNENFKLRYCYFQFPFDFPDYKHFLDTEYNIKYLDYSYLYCYSQALYEAPLKNYFTFLRYDYSGSEYKKGVHGASHIHVGFSNSMRLTFDKILTPEAFVFFTLKQIYKQQWEKMISDGKFISKLKSFKENCSLVKDKNLFNDLDLCEFYIT